MYRAEVSVNARVQTTAKSHSFPWGNTSVLVNHCLTGELPQGKGKQADFVFCDPNPLPTFTRAGTVMGKWPRS